MQYEIQKLRHASLYCTTLAQHLEDNWLNEEAMKLEEADLVSHIERLILVAQKLRGVKIDIEKARNIVSMI